MLNLDVSRLLKNCWISRASASDVKVLIDDLIRFANEKLPSNVLTRSSKRVLTVSHRVRRERGLLESDMKKYMKS
mgnify:CR=1 FL=1